MGFIYRASLRSVCVLALAAVVVTLSDVRRAQAGWGIMDASYITAKAQKMGRFCSVQWNSAWLGPKSAVRSYPEVVISGADLAGWISNTDPMINLLHSLNVEAARTGSVDKLKSLMLGMASQRHFTKLQQYRPKTWNGTVPSWMSSYNGLAEPAYAAALFLVPAAHSYAILEPHLTANEKNLLKAWGTAIYKTSHNARDGSKGKANDRQAAKAAGFVSWGAATEDRAIFRSGVSWFKGVVRNIKRDGRDHHFAVADYMHGRELKYLNMTYGQLSIAAAVMESTGQTGFGYKNGGGSLADGLNFLISRSFDPAARQKISKNQADVRFASQPRHVSVSSWSFMEFAALSSVVRQNVPLWKQALNVRGGKGFYGGHHGGYTSCLFGN